MMNCLAGARNSSGFRQQIQQGVLPPETHLTYEGLFNELTFKVGPQTDKLLDLHIGYSRFQFTDSKFDPNINDYLALFLKSSQDGKEREDSVAINIVICLDVSGSMGSGLQSQSKTSRLELSVSAIRSLVSKLKPNDSIGLVTFHNQAQVVFDSVPKKLLTGGLQQKIDQVRAGGGTTIINGLRQAKRVLLKYMSSQENQKSQNRIILLTDVCDSTISNELAFVQDAANNEKINLSIIGISTQFQSQTCEIFKNVKGFNYFCAVQQQDIKKYVFQTFDYGFFPTANNIQIRLQSQDILDLEVFGTPDSQQVKIYNKDALKSEEWTVSRVKSTFPSEIEIVGGDVLTVGGLILVKLKRKTENPYFRGLIRLSYEDLQQKTYHQDYKVDFEFHPKEQFFSGEELEQAIEGFVFTSELKGVLRASRTLSPAQIFSNYGSVVQKLEGICPKQKLKQLQQIRKIIKEYGKADEKEKVKM